MEPYQSLCRLCLSAEEVEVDVFKRSGALKTYYEKISELCGIKVILFPLLSLLTLIPILFPAEETQSMAKNSLSKLYPYPGRNEGTEG